MATRHSFRAHLVWQKSEDAIVRGNHRVEFDGKPPLDVSAASQYRGDPSRLNPEELLVASLASCQMLTYLALAARAAIDVLDYEDHAEGVLTIAEKKMRVTEVILRPRITIAAGADQAKARSPVEAAHDGCFIANSVACAVRLEPEITGG